VAGLILIKLFQRSSKVMTTWPEVAATSCCATVLVMAPMFVSHWRLTKRREEQPTDNRHEQDE
jgi:hypothetical protein